LYEIGGNLYIILVHVQHIPP